MKNAMAIAVVCTVMFALAFTALSLTGCEQDLSIVTLTSIKAVYGGGAKTIHSTTNLDDLKTDLTVTAYYSNNSEKKLLSSEYSLSGTLAHSVSTITVTYKGKTDHFDVTVTNPLSGDITYEVIQDGGEDNETDSTGIVFTFSASIDSLNLTAGDITVGGTADKDTNATLTGSGKIWTLAPITVTHAGQATVEIDKTGIIAGTKHVTVYKADEAAPTLTGITAVYSSAAIIYPTTPLDSLKADLTVTAQYSDNSDETLSDNEYTLGGTLSVGTSTITVTYIHDGVTETDQFTVTVTAPVLTGITATYNGTAPIYPATPLDNLKTNLTVKAQYSDNTDKTLLATDYTLGGALTAGTSTVTVTYTDNGVTKTITFTVTVTPSPPHNHTWGSWAATATEGTEERVCTTNNAHKQTRLTGTTRFAFTAIGDPVTGYNVRKNGSYTGAVTIPDFYRPGDSTSEDDFKPITAIGTANDAFANWAFYQTGMSTIYIPESVTVIGQNAFQNCSSLTSITIPASVTVINNSAFNGASNLATVTIAEGSQLESIGDNAFQSTAITSIVIPASVTYLGTSAFRTCNNLATVTFAAGSQLTLINNSSFSACRSLVSIEIPASVTTIGNSAFAGSTTSSAPSTPTALTTVTFAAGSQLTSIENYAFRFNANLTTVTFAEGTELTSIGTMVFDGCTNQAELDAVMQSFKKE